MFASILRKKKTKKRVQPKQSHSFFLANWFGSDIAIDLGTANIIVFVKNRGIVVNEPAVIAVDTMENKVVAIGREAQAMLGMLYLLGRGVTRNYAKARHYFEQALQGGELNVEAAVAQYWLGQMYKEGIGVQKDCEKGEKLIHLAAINGYAPHGK